MRETIEAYAQALTAEAESLRGDRLTSMIEDIANDAVAKRLDRISADLTAILAMETGT